MMNNYGGDLGSHYRGRVLYKPTSVFNMDPKTETIDLNFKFPEFPVPSSPQKSYCLRVDILEGN